MLRPFFVGGYSDVIHRSVLDTDTGDLAQPVVAAHSDHASFLAYVSGFRSLYAVGETEDPAETGSIARFAVDEGGALVSNERLETCGAGPCHIAVDAQKRLAVSADYRGGTVTAVELAAQGELRAVWMCTHHEGHSVNAVRQEQSHPHCATFAPGGEYLLVCDLGVDAIHRYRLAPGSAEPLTSAGSVPVDPGSGPRHLIFGSDRHAYLVNELSSTVTVYTWDPPSGELLPVQTVSALPRGFAGESTAAEVQVHPGGRFVYVSNRGADSIAVFSRDASTGRLGSSVWFEVGGAIPRHFAIDPGGRWIVVALQRSGLVRTLAIDPLSGVGRLTAAAVEVQSPSCVAFT